MLSGTSLFGQVLKLIPRLDFESAVRRHQAEHAAKGFSCWDQFVAMLFCQLAQAKSLREICDGLASCAGKLQHLGVSRAPKRSTLAYANEHRPWELYQTVFYQLLATCRLAAHGRKPFRFKHALYSFDSTTVDLCLSLFDWARYMRTKGAIKLHLLLDHEGYLPVFAHLTDGKVGDVVVARLLDLPADSMVVLDRGYLDYAQYAHWTAQGVWFVTRARINMDYRVIEHAPVRESSGVIEDVRIKLVSPHALQQGCTCRLRRISYRDPASGETFVFLTNHMRLAAATIARVYKDRWQIEAFFRTLKQNLKIKTFVGTGPNAVRVQIWTALIAMLVLKYLQLKSRLGWSLSNLVALLHWSLFTYRDLWRWIDDPFNIPPEPPGHAQLILEMT
jgi:transposase